MSIVVCACHNPPVVVTGYGFTHGILLPNCTPVTPPSKPNEDATVMSSILEQASLSWDQEGRWCVPTGPPIEGLYDLVTLAQLSGDRCWAKPVLARKQLIPFLFSGIAGGPVIRGWHLGRQISVMRPFFGNLVLRRVDKQKQEQYRERGEYYGCYGELELSKLSEETCRESLRTIVVNLWEDKESLSGLLESVRFSELSNRYGYKLLRSIDTWSLELTRALESDTCSSMTEQVIMITSAIYCKMIVLLIPKLKQIGYVSYPTKRRWRYEYE